MNAKKIVLALVIAILVLAPNFVFAQYNRVPRDTSAYFVQKANHLKKVDTSSGWYFEFKDADSLITATRLSSDAYQGNFSREFEMSGKMIVDGAAAAQISVARRYDHVEQPDTFVYHIKCDSSIFLHDVVIGVNGERYWGFLHPRKVPADGKWREERVWNANKPFTVDPFVNLDFCLYFTNYWDSIPHPFYAKISIDDVYGIYEDGSIKMYEDFEDTTTGIDDSLVPTDEIMLEQNYPNPFNPTTTISFSLPQAENVKLMVYDMLGEEVAVLVDGYTSAGTHETSFDASRLASGMYVYRLQVGSSVLNKKMMLMK